MRRWIIWGAAFHIVWWSALPARADALADCVVAKSSPTDRADLIRWVFAAVSLNPAVKSLATIKPADREDANKKTAALLERLLTVDCRKESMHAIKYEGTQAIVTAFGVLGKVAMTGLMSDPSVASGMGLEKYLNDGRLEQLGRDAAKAD